MLAMPRVLMVGGTGRRVGKTAFVCAVLERLGRQYDLAAVKITTVDSFNRSHHPPLCTWRIEEAGPHPRSVGHDTARMFACGAKRVFWLQVPETRLEEGMAALLERLGPDTLSVWESTRGRRLGEPGAFVMIEDVRANEGKPWAGELARQADRVVAFDGTTFEIDWSDIQCLEGRWAVRMNATVVLLAGGGSTRMGVDKTLLPIAGKPMIQRLRDQLRPWFAHILVSSNNPAAHGFLGETIVGDLVAGRGPLMGVVSALRAAPDELCFVLSCDIPEVDIDLVRSLVRRAHDCDAVVPHDGRPQPLCAVYRRSTAGAFESAEGGLSWRRGRMTDALDCCRVKYVPVAPGRIRNLNTMDEYQRYIGRASDVGA